MGLGERHAAGGARSANSAVRASTHHPQGRDWAVGAIQPYRQFELSVGHCSLLPRLRQGGVRWSGRMI
nr:hypothetical protein CDS [Bradyrhizobium sp.]